MAIFGKSIREKELEEEVARLKKQLSESNRDSGTAGTTSSGKSKYVTKQCKYCGYRVTYLAKGIPPGVTCPKRGKGQPHVWQTLGYEFK